MRYSTIPVYVEIQSTDEVVAFKQIRHLMCAQVDLGNEGGEIDY